MEKDYYSAHYKGFVGELETYYENEIVQYHRQFGHMMSGFDKNARCLDLGCGVGNFVAYLNSQRFVHVTGIDTSAESIDICKNKFPRYAFYQESISEYLVNNDETYDIISMFSIIEHLPKGNIIPLLSLIRSKLNKPDGTLIISTPNMCALFGNTGGRYGDFTHTTGFTESSLRQCLLMAGFTAIQIEGPQKKRSTLKQKILYDIYQPIVLKLLKWFFISLGLEIPSIHGYTLFVHCKTP